MQLPIPPRDIGLRGPQVAPGTFTVTLEVDGVVIDRKSFVVRADPALGYSAKDHQARDRFVLTTLDLLAKVDTLAQTITARKGTASGEAAARLQTIEQRLVGAAAGGRGGFVRGGPQAIRQRLTGLLGTYNISGAQTGTLAPPTGAMRSVLADVTREMAVLEADLRSVPSTR